MKRSTLSRQNPITRLTTKPDLEQTLAAYKISSLQNEKAPFFKGAFFCPDFVSAGFVLLTDKTCSCQHMQNGYQLSEKSGFRFSINACIPSFWSSVANSE